MTLSNFQYMFGTVKECCTEKQENRFSEVL